MKNKSKHPLYRVWHSMINRCYLPKNTAFKHYGGRGITVCKRWRESFENFCADMGERPFEGATVERKNGNGNYSKENCIWATMKTQQRNRSDNRKLTLKGKTQCVSAWCEEIGISRWALESRLERGWSDEKALTTPVKKPDTFKIGKKSKTLKQWCKEFNVEYRTVWYRINKMGWTAEKALKTKAMTHAQRATFNRK